MLLEMKVPSPGESISEVEIAQWLVEDGEYVEKDHNVGHRATCESIIFNSCVILQVTPGHEHL